MHLKRETPMLFAVICKDKPGEGLARRMATRPAHLAYLQDLGDTVKCAGGLLNAEGTEPRGSLLIIEAEDLDAAKALAAGDPYAGADVFESVEIIPWRPALGPFQL
jgi:uncharacterized protein